jgi:glycine cleavage system H lipoate-binding protein
MVKPYGDFRNFVYFYLIVTNKRIKVTKFQKEEIESIHYVNFDKYLSDSKNGKTLMTYESHKKIFNKIKLIINKYNKYAQK